MPEVLPDLGLLAAALFLLLIASALWVLAGLLRNSLGRLPVVGSWINSNVVAALNDARNAVLGGARSSWHAAVQLFRWAEAFIRLQGEWEISAVTATWNFGRRLYDSTLPRLETRVLAAASGWFANAESLARSLWANATAYATRITAQAVAEGRALFATAEHDAAAAFATAEAATVRAFDTAESDARRLVAAARAELDTGIRAAELAAADGIDAVRRSLTATAVALGTEITAGVRTAETLAAVNLSAAVGGIYTDLETLGDKAVTEAWPDAAGELATLRRTLGADFPWLNDLLGLLAGAGAAGLAGTLTRSMATSQALTRLANDCIVPQCRNLGGLSHDLGNLLSDASTAAMLAWLIFGVIDPAGWAADTGRVAAPVASGLADTAAHLFREG